MIEFSWPVRVYYEDTDAGGVVYHANYLKFLERARTEMLRKAGFDHERLQREENIVFIVYRVCVDYLKPAFMNDLLSVNATITRFSGARLYFNQSIQNQQDDFICKAEVRIACVDTTTLKPVPIPDNIIAELENVN